jgi:hypothetical protein
MTCEARQRLDSTRLDRSDHTASRSVILVDRRPQSLACGAPYGATGIDPVAQPGSRAVMPLRVRRDPPLPGEMRQREHRNEAIGTASATFMNEAIRHPSCLSSRTQPCHTLKAWAERQCWQNWSTSANDPGACSGLRLA